MNTILKIIAPALLVVLFTFLVGAQTSASAQERVDRTAERAYLYAAFCEGSKSSYRKQACELLFTSILVDLGGSNFRNIAPRKRIDKIHNIID